eukprot:CAMPEP_0114340626 /NCGR_PEP_ID=MMETSP0101-20121206/8493_1 /TAXON_ID=38822 ORGANISM="Pteridomonas danica, Strain PT" /NCGR_SAMPLE_ID=MMETSP0101 /ASSEMBLY_ACC=CAM_ASM_000211 /LENGTH=102 /DNA_ID=CAMNT_0001473933 /DNA_START=519 /DNA_END=827 /DNA_ORIENTATION=-
MKLVNVPEDNFFGCPSEFHERLLEARDQASRSNTHVITANVISPDLNTPVVTAVTVTDGGGGGGGGGGGAAQRLKTLQDLKDQGLISEDEFNQRRQEIIKSI